MENKEDLLNLENKKNPKKILIYGAAAFLVFVIGVIVFALFGGKTSNKEDNTIIPPQVKEEPLFKEIPIESENPKNTNQTQNIQKTSEPTTSPKPQQISKPKSMKEENKSIVKNEPKKELKEIKKEVKSSKPVKKKVSSKVKYYVQVAALMKYAKPNKKFLELLKKYGYNYVIYPVVIDKNGQKIKVNKLLVGPFNSKEEAKKELIKIRKYITQNAFIFKVSK